MNVAALRTDVNRCRAQTCAQVVLAAARQEHTGIDEVTLQQLSMLRILHAICATALDAFRAADNPVDAELVFDLERMVERTRVELERFAKPS
jgi:hypothetical protein